MSNHDTVENSTKLFWALKDEYDKLDARLKIAVEFLQKLAIDVKCNFDAHQTNSCLHCAIEDVIRETDQKAVVEDKK